MTRVISRKTFHFQSHGCPVPVLPTSPHPAGPESPAGTAQAGGRAGPALDVPTLDVPTLDFLLVGCSLDCHPSIQNQGCLGLRSGRWRRAYTSAALLILYTRGLSRSFSSPGERGTTEAGQGRFGFLAGTRSPSRVDWSCLPAVCPAGAHTWSHSGHAPRWWSRLEDVVHSSRLPSAPPSPGWGRLVEGPGAADGLSQAGPCWLQGEVEVEHYGLGSQTATALSWPLCTSEYELFCSETTPGQERKKIKEF